MNEILSIFPVSQREEQGWGVITVQAHGVFTPYFNGLFNLYGPQDLRLESHFLAITPFILKPNQFFIPNVKRSNHFLVVHEEKLKVKKILYLSNPKNYEEYSSYFL